MTKIFLFFDKKDAECAEQVLQTLEAKGYSCWREPPSLSTNSSLYKRVLENALLGSSALVLMWSKNAVRSDLVESLVSLTHHLKKTLLPFIIDESKLPDTFGADLAVRVQTSCANAVTHLLPLLPPANNTDPLHVLAERAADNSSRVRKEAIEQAAILLQSRGEQREIILAILTYLASNDVMPGVRGNAQAVLDADIQKNAPQSGTDESRHIFGVKCKNGHVSLFDKRDVCSASRPIDRHLRLNGEQKLDELHLQCDHCGTNIVASVDCRGYK